jgi:hypothetical protein
LRIDDALLCVLRFLWLIGSDADPRACQIPTPDSGNLTASQGFFSSRRPGVAVDAGPEYEHYRAAFVAAGLPVFGRMEEALLGLRALAQACSRRGRSYAGRIAGRGDGALARKGSSHFD